MEFLELYQNLKNKTKTYNEITDKLKDKKISASKLKKQELIENELIQLHEQLLKELPALQEKADKNLIILRLNSVVREGFAYFDKNRNTLR